jgi:hypothetical protein
LEREDSLQEQEQEEVKEEQPKKAHQSFFDAIG